MTKTRAVHFSFCKDGNCAFSECDPHHLSIRRRLLEVKRGNATAISYTWGEFERRDICLGHFEDSKALVMMHLGQEWEVNHLRSTLTSLSHPVDYERSSEGEYFWIDQLSILQNDPEDIRETLANIPEIFRSFDVIALIAGARCECWSERAAQAKAQIPREQTDDEDRKLLKGLISRPCINDLSLYPWLYRLWPRQEALYAQNLRFVWTIEHRVTCSVNLRDTRGFSNSYKDPEWSAMTKTAELWYKHNVASSRDLLTLSIKCHRVLEALEHLIDDWIALKSPLKRPHPDEAFRHLFEFMLGKPLRAYDWTPRGLPGPQGSSDLSLQVAMNVSGFLYQLSRITRTPRRATNKQDYVLSVWVDCPGYVIPTSYLHMTVQELLGNALQQLKGNHDTFIGAHAPLGLFGYEGSLSHAWHLNVDHEYNRLESVVDYYASIPLVPAAFTHDWRFNPRIISKFDYHNASDLVYGIEEVEKSKAGRLLWIINAVDLMMTPLHEAGPIEDIVSECNHLQLDLRISCFITIVGRYLDAKRQKETFGIKEAISPTLSRLLGSESIKDETDGCLAFLRRMVEFDEFDLNQVVRMIVCHMLGINYRLSYSAGLRILLNKSFPMMGFCRYNFSVRGNETFMRAYPPLIVGLRMAMMRQMIVKEVCHDEFSCEVVGAWVPADLRHAGGEALPGRESTASSWVVDSLLVE